MAAPRTEPAGRRLPVLFALFLASGAAALIYQVLWARELARLFGSTAQGAALTVAIFFAGLAIGGWLWGSRTARMGRPLRTFGWLEVGVAVTATAFLGLLDLYVALEPTLVGLVGDGPVAEVVLRAGVATVVLLPSAVLMGGTLPVLGQHLVDARRRLGRTGSALYATNTLGSAAGALAAGFLLPPLLGYLGTYLLAVGIDLTVGLAALLLARTVAAAERPGSTATPTPASTPAPAARPTSAAPTPAGAGGPRPPRDTAPSVMRDTPLTGRTVWALAFASGLLTLAIEVIWTRLFSQVLQNSAYTYALVLAAFLLALALGAGAASALARTRLDPTAVVLGLLLTAGTVSAAGPWWFHTRTDGLTIVGGTADFGGYVAAVAGLAAVTMVVPVVVLGALLPYLLRVLEDRDATPGQLLGRLVAVNTVGGIVGALAAGFVLLPALGAWRATLWVAAAYAALAAVVAWPPRSTAPTRRRAALALSGAAGVAAVAALAATPDDLAVVRLGDDQRLVDVREGVAATVSVVDDGPHRSIRVDNLYTLGGTRGLDAERNQSTVPLLTLHPAPRSVFYLGMGTGITAGAGLAFDVDRIVVCELLDDVIRAADEHFAPWTNGLFDDPRADIRAADGRTCLRRSDETFDLIVADLFNPWDAGTGDLYTAEHYRTAQQRLADGGAYVQWVALYQVTDDELGTIAATMDDVFDEVTMWRGDHYAQRSIVALVGRDDPEPFDPAVAASQGRQLTDEDLPDRFHEALALRMYVGNVTASGRYADRPRNTDRQPVIEYTAPISQRAVRAGDATFLTGPAREELYDQLRDDVAYADDPALARLDDRQLGYVEAGRSYSRFRYLDRIGADEARGWLDDFLDRSPPEARGVDDVSPARRLPPA